MRAKSFTSPQPMNIFFVGMMDDLGIEPIFSTPERTSWLASSLLGSISDLTLMERPQSPNQFRISPNQNKDQNGLHEQPGFMSACSANSPATRRWGLIKATQHQKQEEHQPGHKEVEEKEGGKVQKEEQNHCGDSNPRNRLGRVLPRSSGNCTTRARD